MLVSVLGDSVVEVVTGVVAVSTLLGMRLPLELWPRVPQRSEFSIALTIVVALVVGALVVLAKPTQIPGDFVRFGRAAVPVVLIGGVAWSIAWGRTDQLAFARWYGIAAACALLPVAMAVASVAVRGDMPAVDFLRWLRASCFFVAVGTAGVLVTQELAFRRLLVGQSGDAGVLVVTASAAVFGLWHGVIPADGGVLPSIASGFVNGVVSGSLYLLSRSLLVPAAFHGLQSGFIKGLQASVDAAPGQATDLWFPLIVATMVPAVLLALHVNRRAGLVGSLSLRNAVPDAVGD